MLICDPDVASTLAIVAPTSSLCQTGRTSQEEEICKHFASFLGPSKIIDSVKQLRSTAGMGVDGGMEAQRFLHA